MGYYAEAERAYDPDRDLPVARWHKRDKMTVADIKQILEDFIQSVSEGGKDYQWCSGVFGAPVALRISHPGMPDYESAGRSLVGQPGYGTDSILYVNLSLNHRHYLVDLTDVEKLQKQLGEIADETYNRLEEWDDSQAAAEGEDESFEDDEPED